MNVLKLAETTMTPEEAEAIVRRLAEHSTSGGPRIDDLAEALGVSPEEVAATLAEVRSASLPKRKRRVVRRERRLWLLSGVAALAVCGGLVGGMWAWRWGPFAPSERAATAETLTVPAEAASPLGVAGKGAYAIFLDGAPVGHSKFVGDRTATLRDGLADWVEGAVPEETKTPTSMEQDQNSRKALQSGKWDDIVGIRFALFEIRTGDADGKWLRWAGEGGSIPIYNGDDALIAEAVRKERDRRVAQTLESALNGLPAR